jgi:hypothetical protein
MRRAVVAAVLALPLAPALACGACDEDKIAATYDHAAVQRAASQKRVVVFCDVQGQVLDAERMRRVAAATSGIDAASVRTSSAPTTISFTVDPRRRSPQSAAAALQRGAPAGTRIAIVRVLGA